MKLTLTLPAPHEGEVYINGALQTQPVTIEIKPIFYEGSGKQAVAYAKAGKEKRTMITVDKTGKITAQPQKQVTIEDDDVDGTTQSASSGKSFAELAREAGAKQRPEHPRNEAAAEGSGAGK